MQTPRMQLSADEIVGETSDWPEDSVADLIDIKNTPAAREIRTTGASCRP